MMSKSILRRIGDRFLHSLARKLPGAQSVRPFLHRLRGVSMGADVFIGEEVYIENEYPEVVEIGSGVQIALRTIILAHTRGPGRVIIENDVFIGANAIIAASSGKTLRIGEGAVVGPGVVITSDVAPHLFIASETARPVARALVPLAKAESMEEFVRGLAPLKGPAKRGS